MREKGFRFLVGLVMITATTGCDNVAFGGIQVELRPPPPPPGGSVAEDEETTSEELLAPMDLGPVLYLVERLEGSVASILPIAELTEEGYRALPDFTEVSGFLSRFPIRRWDSGAEFVLFGQGGRAGTFLADGTIATDSSTCLVRPSALGRIEIRPEAIGERHFLALAGTDVAGTTAVGPLTTGSTQDAALRVASLSLAQRLIPEMGVPWPPTIPEIRRDLRPVILEAGSPPGFAVSFVYGDDLVVGAPTPLAYSLFVLAESAGTRYEPVAAWYQRFDRGGKAFPRLLAAHDLHGTGRSDVLLEVYGESGRWLAILGPREDRWQALFQDGCGVPIDADGLRTFP